MQHSILLVMDPPPLLAPSAVLHAISNIILTKSQTPELHHCCPTQQHIWRF